MKQFTTEQIQEQFKKLPRDLQEAVSSADVQDVVKTIGRRNNLQIDQLGDMIYLVGLVMLGLSPSKDFVKNLTNDTGIDDSVATTMAKEINTEVFGKIRSSMQKIEEADDDQAKQDLTAIERAGGFNIEKSTQNDDSDDQATPDVTEADKSQILSSIEDPAPKGQVNVLEQTKFNGQTSSKSTNPEPETLTEPLVDHLLSTATARPVEKIIQKEVVNLTSAVPNNLPTSEKTSKTQTPMQKPKGPDMYRESIM